MRTKYDKLFHFPQRASNVVDLEAFRRKTALAQRDCLARKAMVPSWSEEEKPVFQPVVLVSTPAQRRRARRERRSWTLDACASLAVVLMTLVFVLRVMLCA